MPASINFSVSFVFVKGSPIVFQEEIVGCSGENHPSVIQENHSPIHVNNASNPSLFQRESTASEVLLIGSEWVVLEVCSIEVVMILFINKYYKYNNILYEKDQSFFCCFRKYNGRY